MQNNKKPIEEDLIRKEEEYWKNNPPQSKVREYYSFLYKDLDFNIREPILDIGGGSGTFLSYLNIKKATIVDLAGSESLVNKNYKFIRKDITKKLNLKKKYKTIFVMEVLEHIYNPLYLMSQVYDILDNDGICYVAVPYTKLDPQRKLGLNSHVCRWKDYEIKEDMEKIGFNVNFILKRRRYLNTAFWLPHCFLVLELKK